MNVKGEVQYTNHWVINSTTKFFLCFKAGIASPDDPEQLLIALEPEAASVYCREKKMRDFTSERGDASVSDVFARPGSRYLVIDIGGNNSVKPSYVLPRLTKKNNFLIIWLLEFY